MNNDAMTRLHSAFDKFNNKIYDTKEFHTVIESIIFSITEVDCSDLRDKLLKFESELEFVDFMVDKNKRRESYSDKINNLIEWLVKK